MATRELEALLPHVAAAARSWAKACMDRGVTALIYCTYRSPEEQDALYAIGRDIPGKIVTNARGGFSWHNWRRAWDAVPLKAGKPLWEYAADSPEWLVMVEEADRRGIEWAGRWKRFREYCHWQITDGHSIRDLVSGSKK